MKHVFVFNRVCNIGTRLLLYMYLSIQGSKNMPSKSGKVERLTAHSDSSSPRKYVWKNVGILQ